MAESGEEWMCVVVLPTTILILVITVVLVTTVLTWTWWQADGASDVHLHAPVCNIMRQHGFLFDLWSVSLVCCSQVTWKSNYFILYLIDRITLLNIFKVIQTIYTFFLKITLNLLVLLLSGCSFNFTPMEVVTKGKTAASFVSGVCAGRGFNACGASNVLDWRKNIWNN